MRLHWLAKEDSPVGELDNPNPLSAHTALGSTQCDGIGCSSQGGIACAYIDRRGRLCPTAWCPGHRAVFDGNVYCPLHGATMSGLHWDFGDSPHPDVDNRIPALVAWVSHTAEDDIVATLRSICADRDEVLVSDPVRQVLLGVERTRTWERAWKVCSVVGVSARVTIAVEEANPHWVLAKVNSKVIAHLEAPPEDLSAASQPAAVELLFRQLVMPIALALDFWQQGKPIEAEAIGVGVSKNTPAPPPPPEPSLSFQGQYRSANPSADW
jgi:hypothetical protein